MARKSGERRWFKLWVEDWLGSASIELMGAAGEGAYLRLLCRAWQSDTCSLPDDDEALAVISRLGRKAWDGKIGKLVKSKFRSEGGRLYNDKLLEEFRLYEQKKVDSHNGGVLSAEKKKAERQGKVNGKSSGVELPLWLNEAIAQGHLDEAVKREVSGVEVDLTESSSGLELHLNENVKARSSTRARDQNPEYRIQKTEEELSLCSPSLAIVPNEREGRKPTGWDAVAASREFMAEYPKQTAGIRATQAFHSLIENEGEFDCLMAGLARWKASAEWKRSLDSDGGRFVPNPDKFIFNRRYNDYPESSSGSGSDSVIDRVVADFFRDKRAS